MQQPIYNPSIPFTGAIFGGMQEGKMVMIQGQVPQYAKRFQVDFQCGAGVSPRPDIALHFNPRFSDGELIVCNSLQNQRWGSEERKQGIPLSRGTYFELIFHLRPYCFQVSANGNHLLEYNHRLPFNRVDTLGISGDVTISTITFTSPGVPAFAPPPYTPMPAYMSPQVFSSPPVMASPTFAAPAFHKPTKQQNLSVSNPVVPYVGYVGGLRPQQKIKIVGTFPARPNKFTVNLKMSSTSSIALHMDQRFNENALVRNSCINQTWGSEERDLPFLPFLPGQTFEMTISVHPTCYQITVNGRHLVNFNHRLQPLNHIDQLEVTGDLTLSLVQF
uniref:Galectin n=1 Tax=Callorhinchus milii TaxID=7868 RepID=V9KY82_CALMI